MGEPCVSSVMQGNGEFEKTMAGGQIEFKIGPKFRLIRSKIITDRKLVTKMLPSTPRSITANHC
jgi:hypothetical protein